MKIAIIGLGWFGFLLAEKLQKQHEVVGTTRTIEKQKELSKKVKTVCLLNIQDQLPHEIRESDLYIINIPPFEGQLDWLRSWQITRDKKIIFISSISVFGSTQDVDDQTIPQPDSKNGKLLLELENWIQSEFAQSTIIRFGGLIGPQRHPGKYFAGKSELTGENQPVNLLQLEDAIAFTELIIEKNKFKEKYNLVNPEHPSRKNYYSQYCNTKGLPLPDFIVDNSKGRIVSSKKVQVLYQFKKSIEDY